MPDLLATVDYDVDREITLLAEEGLDVARYRRAYAQSRTLERSARIEALQRLLRRLDRHLTIATELEPYDLESIRKARPSRGPRLDLSGDKERLYDHVLGGWLGRCAGCLLGAALEVALATKDQIERYLREANAYPLSDYVPVTPELLARYPLRECHPRATLGNVKGMPRDDDIDYAVLNLLILEKHGFAFTPHDCTEEWLERLTFYKIWCGARVAYRNLANGLEPPETAIYHNPYRQSLGGQIRADLWGYVSPGNPELASELAYRDSSITQVRNGIYSAMFFAATIAASYVAHDVAQAVEAGLAQIPESCSLAVAIGRLLAWTASDGDWQVTLDRIYHDYGHQVFNYSIVNALLSLLGPLYTRDDLTGAIGITVMGGFDTDSTGATAGSIMGVRLGARSLPPHWIEPLEDRFESHLAGVGTIRISELARRTFQLLQWPPRRP